MMDMLKLENTKYLRLNSKVFDLMLNPGLNLMEQLSVRSTFLYENISNAWYRF